MPCDTIQTTTVDFGKADHALLAKALKELGWNVTAVAADGIEANNARGESLEFSDGRFEISGNGYSTPVLDEKEVRRAYSRQVVNYAAQRFGWSLKQNPADKNKFTATKKAF